MTVNQSSRFMAVQFVAGQVGALLLDVSYFAFKLRIAAFAASDSAHTALIVFLEGLGR